MRLKGLLLFCYIADGISDLITNNFLRRRTLSTSDQRINGTKLSTKEFQGLHLSTNSDRDYLSTVEDYPIISSDGDRFKISSRFLGPESESETGSRSKSGSRSKTGQVSGSGSDSKSGPDSGSKSEPDSGSKSGINSESGPGSGSVPGSGSKSGPESRYGDEKVIKYYNDQNVFIREEYRPPPPPEYHNDQNDFIREEYKIPPPPSRSSSRSESSSSDGGFLDIFFGDSDESESSESGFGIGGVGAAVAGVAGVAAVGTGVVVTSAILGTVGAGLATAVGIATLNAAGEPDPDLVGTLPLNIALNVRDTVLAPTQAPESTNTQLSPTQHPMAQSTYDASQELLQASQLSIGNYLAQTLPRQIVAVPASSFTLNYNILNEMTGPPSNTDIAEVEFITGLFINEKLKRYYGTKPYIQFCDLTLTASGGNGGDNSISITYYLKTIFSHDYRLPTKEDVDDIVGELFTGYKRKMDYLGLLKGKLGITNPFSLVNDIALRTESM